MKVPALLKNKYVCYALMALATLNIIGYVTVKAWECLALFSLAGYSAHCYCKNVSLAILAALFVANFVFGCGRVKEGFEDALKGPVEHLKEAKDEAEQAQKKCDEVTMGADATEAKNLCIAAVNATGAACTYAKAKLQGCVDTQSGEVVPPVGGVVWEKDNCETAGNTWNAQASDQTCA